jgi:recombination protein RecR
MRSCPICFNSTDREVCEICSSEQRDRSLLCVVADPRDLIGIERTNEYRGLYYVLGGVISPLEGIGPDQLRIRELVQRVREGGIEKVILAFGPQVQEQHTALYVQQRLKPLGLRISQMCFGPPRGLD